MAFRFLPLLFACIIALGASPVGAVTTMTFDGLVNEGETTSGASYRENGIIASPMGGVLATDGRAGAAHIDDGGSGFTDNVTFRLESGMRFDPVSFDIIPLGTSLCMGFSTCGIPYDNVRVAGFRDGAMVARERFYMGDAPSTVVFGTAFADLTAVMISAVFPDFASLPPDLECIDLPCGHFEIDSVTLDWAMKPVPLPRGVLLLLAAIGTLGLVSVRWA